MSIQLGVQSLAFAMLARRYATLHGLLPRSSRYNDVLNWFSMEHLLQLALVLVVPGIFGLLWAVYAWSQTGFGLLQYTKVLRVMILALGSISCAVQLAFSAFLAGIMEIPRRPA